MNLVLYAHPLFLGFRSQDHFARMLADALVARGHRVELRRPAGRVHDWVHGWVQSWVHGWVRARVRAGGLTKWAGYIDQYLLFPGQMRQRMQHDPADTLYVFCDQALGPWVPLAARRPHVVHCHDLLALRSALGEVPENRTSSTGRMYQRYIRWGFAQAQHFISISMQTRRDLHRLGRVQPRSSRVVYLGLNHPYAPMTPGVARLALHAAGLPTPPERLLVHVGGGQWYKNTVGVVALYGSYVQACAASGRDPLPLWMVSPPPSAEVQAALARVPASGQVRFFQSLPPAALQGLYSLAAMLLFPSLAEGFGWPIAESMACGCPVLTTGEPPMNEVAGDAAIYLPRLGEPSQLHAWSQAGAAAVLQFVHGPAAAREGRVQAGLERARLFSAGAAIDAYVRIYGEVIEREAATVQAA